MPLYILYYYSTGCSLNILFFPKILENSELWSFSVFPWRQCVYTHQAGRKPALQKNGKLSRILGKNKIFNEHPVDKKTAVWFDSWSGRWRTWRTLWQSSSSSSSPSSLMWSVNVYRVSYNPCPISCYLGGQCSLYICGVYCDRNEGKNTVHIFVTPCTKLYNNAMIDRQYVILWITIFFILKVLTENLI